MEEEAEAEAERHSHGSGMSEAERWRGTLLGFEGLGEYSIAHIDPAGGPELLTLASRSKSLLLKARLLYVVEWL